MIANEDFEDFDGHVRQAEARGNRPRHLHFRVVLDARIRVHLLKICRRFADGVEARQLVAQRVRLLRRAQDIHDGPGVGPGEPADHERAPSTSFRLSRKSFWRSASVIFSLRSCSARSLASSPAYSVSSWRACLSRLSTSLLALWRIFWASASAATINSCFCFSPSLCARSPIKRTSSSS